MFDAVVRNREGERLAYAFTEGTPGRREIVVIGHGVTSDKDRPWSIGLAQALSAEGIASLRLAFSGNGASEGEFTASTITKEVTDLGSVIDALNGWRVAYIGQSMGAAVGLVRACDDARIVALVSLAGVTHTAEFVDRMFGDLRFGEPMLGKPHCPFGPALQSDLRELGTLASRAARIRVPWLVVHGTEDDVVPIEHSRDLARAAAGRCQLVELEGVDHAFGGGGLEPMISTVVPWLRERMDSASDPA